MASASYSFIDVAVLDEVRARFALGEALAILTCDLTEIAWANGPGAAFFGYPDIEAAIGAPAPLTPAARRQVAATSGFPAIGRDRQISVRLGNGIATLRASAVQLPDGEAAILLALPSAEGTADAEHAPKRAIEGFGTAGHFAALVDAEGAVAAASPGFEELGISQEALRELVAAVHEDADRLVKRPVPGARRFPAGMARLTDSPAMHLLVVVDEPRAFAEEKPDPTATVRAPGPPPAETGHEHWYFGRHEAARPPVPAPEVRQEPHPEAAISSAPVRFVWRMDAESRFTMVSEAFAEAVGAPAADVIGRRFRDVANAFALDPAGEISALMERRDTWSGRTVMWPLSGTALKAPVDLAALPVYGRGRVFEGFRGFGIVRPSEAADDPEGLGLALVPGAAGEIAAAGPAQIADERPVLAAPVAQPPKEERRAEPPPEAPAPGSDKVIRLSEHRPPVRQQTEEVRQGRLSPNEQNAFREIADRLRRDSAQGEPPPAGESTAAPRETSEAGTRPPPGQDPRGGEHDQAASPPVSETVPYTEGGTDKPEGGVAARETEQAPVGPSDGERAGAPPPVPARGTLAFLPSAFAGTALGHEAAGIDPAILSHLPVPVLVHAGDVLHFANGEFLELTGYSGLDELVAAGGLGALFADPYEEGSGRDPDGSSLLLLTATGEERPVRAHLQSVPWRGGKALLLALRSLETALAPEAQGGPSTEELRMRLDEMRTIIDTATDGVVIINNDGLIRSISRPAEALFGFDSADIAGRPFSALFAIESRRAAEDYLSSLSDHGVASVLNDGREVIGREGKGRFIPLFMTIGRLPNDSGYCAVVRDITQWKRAEEELTQARSRAEHTSSQKSEFLARVSHEIRTPLNAIIGFSELMIDEKFGPIGSDRYRDYLRDINRSGNHVLDLVNDLLDISKIEAGEQEMHYEAVSLNDTLGETVAMMQPQANRERVIIRSSFVSHLPDVVADLRSVRQIALNLLSNAVRYTPAGGQVIVSTAYEPSGAVIMRVRDTGLGMSSAELDQALKPFKQLNTLKRRRGDGTGLGLPLTRAMVEANRARFSIDSSPGEGTLVEITFPPTRVLAD